MKLKKILLPIFFLVLACDTYAVITSSKPLEMLFKPLLMPILAGYYLLSINYKANFWFVSALFFSFWGDVLLLFEEKFFVFGLASFLVAHLLYIKMIRNHLKIVSFIHFFKSFAPFLLFFGALMSFIYSGLSEMFIPVLVYGLVIAVFGAFALLNYQQEKSIANLLLLLGAILFVVSDSLIALNKFHNPQKLYDFLIIVLYAISQVLICKAMIKKINN